MKNINIIKNKIKKYSFIQIQKWKKPKLNKLEETNQVHIKKAIIYKLIALNLFEKNIHKNNIQGIIGTNKFKNKALINKRNDTSNILFHFYKIIIIVT